MQLITNFKEILKDEFTGYNKKKFINDLISGITVAAVALPLALAFGVGSGADATAGLITAIIAGIVIGGLSGTSFQISGPTGAMTAILIPLVAKHGLDMLFFATLFAGIILIIAGILKVGKFVYFIPSTVIAGFTSGIAIVIALGQIPNLLGMTSSGDSVLTKILSLFQSGDSINIVSLLIGALVILISFIWPKKWSKIMPSSLAGIIIATIVVLLFNLNVTLVGNIPQTIIHESRLTFSNFTNIELDTVILPAFSIAALCIIESLLSGVAGGRMVDRKMDANQELISQGIGNIIIPFFGGVPATAAIARTSVAIKSGCQTRITSIIHGIVLILSIFLLSSLMSNIPLSALSGVLIITAWRMNEWYSIKYIFSHQFRGPIFKFLITMIFTVVFDLTIAIAVGVFIAVILLLIRMSNVDIDIAPIEPKKLNDSSIEITNNDVKVVYITGMLFFGVIEYLEKNLENLDDKYIVFSMRGVPQIDLSVATILNDFVIKAHNNNQIIIFSSLQSDVREVLDRTGISEIVGEELFFDNAKNAIIFTQEKQL